VVLRFRASRGVESQQLRRIAAAATGAVIGLPLGPSTSGVAYLAVVTVPVTVERFAARLRDQVDLDAVYAELLVVVDQTVQPTQASLWLRAPAATRPSP
jgi:hypothetical protein